MPRPADPRLTVILAGLLASGCAPLFDADPSPTERGVDLGKGDFVASDTLWRTPRIPVCWESMDPRYAEPRAWVEDAVRTSWSAVSAVEFLGFGPCEPGAVGVRVGLTDQAPHTLGLGKELDGVEGGMRLNFDFETWSPGCQETREFCVRAGAVHEFGHAIGFAHEQNRADTPGWCAGERGAFGDLSFSEWDLDSIMNYCNPEWTGDGDLSAADVVAVRALYGRRRGAVVVARSDGSRLGAGDEAFPGGLAERADGARLLLGDVTGDGRADLVVHDAAAGSWAVAVAADAGFAPLAPFGAWPADRRATGLLGDLDGDGRLDAVQVSADGEWTGGLSTGAAFGEPAWLGRLPARTEPRLGDVDGDGRADALAVDGAAGDWFVALSVGSGLGEPTAARRAHGAGAASHLVADVTGDGRVELVAVYAEDGAWWVAGADAQGPPPSRWTLGHGALASARWLMEVDGDARAEAIAFERDTGAWFARGSDGASFREEVVLATQLATSLPSAEPALLIGDVDGDGRDDAVLVF